MRINVDDATKVKDEKQYICDPYDWDKETQ